MRLERRFDVSQPRKRVIELVAKDETLTGLFPDSETRVVERSGDRKTTVSRYRAFGREGEATFHFTFLEDGNVRFEKVCDGRIWRELHGAVTFEPRGQGTRVTIEMEGRTKALIPEFTIRGPMQEQIDQMAAALRKKLQAAAKKA